MTDEQNPQPEESKPVHVSKVHAVLKDIEDGLNTVENVPAHILEWLKAKLQEVKSHL